MASRVQFAESCFWLKNSFTAREKIGLTVEPATRPRRQPTLGAELKKLDGFERKCALSGSNLTMNYAIEANNVMRRIDYLYEAGKLKPAVSYNVIRACAWWYGHPAGPTRAPKHARRLESGILTFGANHFHVNKAVAKCIEIIGREAFLLIGGCQKPDSSRVLNEMYVAVRSSVSNINYDMYSNPYDAPNHMMHFGVQAISVKEFVDEVIKLCEARQLLP